MKLNNIYLESIEHFDVETQDWLLREAPHSRVLDAPEELAFLRDAIVDFGFEDLGLSIDERRSLERAFCGTGAVIPGSDLRLRHACNPDRTLVEPVDGSELLSLPDGWLSAVSAFSMKLDDFVWVGRNVRPERVGNINKSDFDESTFGWLRR